MLTTQAIDAVRSAKGSLKVSLMVFFHATDGLAEMAAITDRSQRRERLRSHYDDAKAPFLAIVGRYGADGIKVVNDLAATPNLIVSGPASGWRKLLTENEGALADEAFEITPNATGWSSDV